jgi:hypothetical protein
MRALLFALPLALCGLGATTTATAAPAALPTPTASQDALYRAFSLRHGEPSCADVSKFTSSPVADLSFLIEHAKQPAVVSMRAAHCLVAAHPTDAFPLMRRWVVTPEQRGLALLVLGSLDELPVDIAIELAQVSRRGPLADAATPRITRAAHPDVAAVALVAVADLPPMPADLQAPAR